MSRYHLVTDNLVEDLKANPQLRRDYLFLSQHPDFKGHWLVQAFDGTFTFDFHELIGPYRAVSPAKLDDFLLVAESEGYRVAFFEEPATILDQFADLNDEPDFEIQSSLPDTIKGLLPFQLQGFNYLKDLDGGVALWSTGTGKSVVSTALLRYHLDNDNVDTAFFVVKNHNKINVQRAILRLAGIDSIVVDGDKQRRKKIWKEVAQKRGTVVITNYEKFRVDKKEIQPIFQDRDILCIWDEMPTKLKRRSTQLYKAICSCLYTTTPPAVNWDKRRPKTLRQWMLSATPIENDPEDFFNTVRLLDPRIFGKVQEFYDEYVKGWNYFSPNEPEVWHHLDRMGLKAAHIIHQVDKDDPDIRDQFPEVIEESYYIDWNPKQRKIYEILTREAVKLGVEDANILALITILQMLCDAPAMIKHSAALYEVYQDALDRWEDYAVMKPPVKEGSELAARLVEALGEANLENDGHTKIDTLKELICETHPDEKIVVFSTFKSLLPHLEGFLQQWNVPYVRYDGTDEEKQKAQDYFMEDPDVRVFLSSDKGSDSLSLEVASVVIHYDLPWKWSTFIQRQNRIHRVVSEFGTVRFYSLMMADSVEDRKRQIIEKKQGYHGQVFKDPGEQSFSARMSQEDLVYILTGN